MATKKKIQWPDTAFSGAPALGGKDAVEIGRLVYENFEDTSVPEIVRSENLNLTPMTLNSCLAAYRVAMNLGDGKWEHLSFAMLRTLDSLVEPQQAAMAKKAAKENWSAHQLQAEVARLNKKKKGKRRGRPALPSIVRSVNQLKSFVDGPRGISASMDSLKELSAEQIEHVKNVVRGLRSQLKDVEGKLK
ncbi:MAG: hypothetical protein R3B07_36020 [Polyangiaceae bacterium]